jgi:hypothetical protein
MRLHQLKAFLKIWRKGETSGSSLEGAASHPRGILGSKRNVIAGIYWLTA